MKNYIKPLAEDIIIVELEKNFATSEVNNYKNPCTNCVNKGSVWKCEGCIHYRK